MNQNNKSQPVKTQADLIQGLYQVSIPINPTGAIYRESTSQLANFIVDMLANTFHLTEADHAFMYPVKDKTGRIVDFQLHISFDTRNGGQNPNISRVTGKNNKQTSGNKPDLMAIAGARFTNGGFRLSDDFKKTMSSIAITQDGNIVVNADPAYDFIGVVECDFFKVIGLCLGIKSSDNYDFSIVSCDPVKVAGEVSLDYMLTITKEITDNVSRRGKKGIDYSMSDMRMLRNSGAGKR